ncbi:MAG: 2-C-methyl-D-erythritol 4-phosphate cytidylyltransferase [Candidatus Cloacimonetes bacterium]|nr:2-C-methyl-D-erythritol 4-phosphate cytidylyltransferase [Candidatus Cloacimonadota bacterium]
MFNTAIITASGSGKRLPGAVRKQFRLLNNCPIIYHTIDRFINHPQVSHIIITLPQDDMEEAGKALLEEYGEEKITLCAGGKERQDSVLNALEIVSDDTDFVLIHDAVRPFITDDLITLLLDLAMKFGGAIPVSHVKNTIKTVTNGLVNETIPREKLFSVHTPQVFRYRKLLELHRKAKYMEEYFTDDASIFEYFQEPVAVLVTDINNIKITDSLDLAFAEFLMRGNKLE